METARWILQLSRPRFWFYVLGPFLIGVAAGISQIDTDVARTVIYLVLIGLFFTLPANLLIYGVNDYFDYETDRLNDKKSTYETLIPPLLRKQFRSWFIAIVLPSLVLTSFLISESTPALLSLFAFLFFGIFYSMPPIRAKTKPFLDAFFNILYIFPGFVAYGFLADSAPPMNVFIAATFWVMAMQAFSAIPDIPADRKAGMNTVATVLGKNGTVIYCAGLYIFSAVYSYEYLGWVSVLAAAVYVSMMVGAFLSSTKEELFKIYTAFPIVNIVVGFVLFWTVYLGNS